MVKETEIHGSILFLLKKYIENTFGENSWNTFTHEAGIEAPEYEMHQNYPIAQMSSILKVVSNHSGVDENNLIEKFGEYLVSDLMIIYKAYIKPEWKTFELLEYTELVMHKAVRKEEITAHPPVLNIHRVHDKLLIIDYYSARKLSALAVGIIKGIATFYKESELIDVTPMSEPQDERVQIRIEFK